MNTLVVTLAALVAGFGAGWTTHSWKVGSAQAVELKAEAKATVQETARVDVVAEKHEATKTVLRTRERVILQEVERVVEKPVYRNVCFDDDGMRKLAKAVAPTSQPTDPMRGPNDTPGGDGGGAAPVGDQDRHGSP